MRRAVSRAIALALELRLLIDVAWMERGVLRRGRVALHVAMHPDRAAVHHATRPRLGRGLDEVSGGVHVNRAVFRVGHAGPAEHRRQVVDELNTVQRPSHECLVPHIAGMTSIPASARGLACAGLRTSPRTA